MDLASGIGNPPLSAYLFACGEVFGLYWAFWLTSKKTFCLTSIRIDAYACAANKFIRRCRSSALFDRCLKILSNGWLDRRFHKYLIACKGDRFWDVEKYYTFLMLTELHRDQAPTATESKAVAENYPAGKAEGLDLK
jgi:hypothetical protein